MTDSNSVSPAIDSYALHHTGRRRLRRSRTAAAACSPTAGPSAAEPGPATTSVLTSRPQRACAAVRVIERALHVTQGQSILSHIIVESMGWIKISLPSP